MCTITSHQLYHHDHDHLIHDLLDNLGREWTVEKFSASLKFASLLGKLNWQVPLCQAQGQGLQKELKMCV